MRKADDPPEAHAPDSRVASSSPTTASLDDSAAVMKALAAARPRIDGEESDSILPAVIALLNQESVRGLIKDFMTGRSAATIAAEKRQFWHAVQRNVLCTFVLIAVCALAYAGKIEGQAVTGLLGGLIGYLIGRKPGE